MAGSVREMALQWETNRIASLARAAAENTSTQRLSDRSDSAPPASLTSERAGVTVRDLPLLVNDPRAGANSALVVVPAHAGVAPLQQTGRYEHQLVQSGVAGMAEPQRRVMSPSSRAGFPTQPCQVCRRALVGPLVVCSSCGAPVHGQCAVVAGHDVLCENCVRQWEDDERRRQQHRAAFTERLF